MLDSPDAHALDVAHDVVATALSDLGDSTTRDVRRAKAFGVLADPQYALDLQACAGIERSGRRLRRPRREAPTLHVHLHVDAIASHGPGDGDDSAASSSCLSTLARVDRSGRRLGARTITTVERWLAGLTPGTSLSVTPVVDVTEDIAVDSYEIPPRLRRQITERDPTCRFHHRVKTTGGWRYERAREGMTWIWTSPLGRVSVVDGHGTTRRC